jgi:hypothetical protein
VPPVAIVLGWAILSETPPWLAVAGGALCLAGVVYARGLGSSRRTGAADTTPSGPGASSQHVVAASANEPTSGA